MAQAIAHGALRRLVVPSHDKRLEKPMRERACFDAYKLYMDLPLFIHKRDHPGTQARKRARRR